jgi:threonine synthase
VITGVASGSGYVADPHTACGLHAAAAATSGAPTVVLATAHPAKFPDAMEKVTGVRPGLPQRLSRLMLEPERYEVLPNDQAAVEAFVARRSRATGGQ